MKHSILLIALMFTQFCTFAQLGTSMAQYSGNQLLYNPACAGFDDLLAVNLSVRKQWIQIPGAPSLISFNAHMPTKNHKHAVGAILQREEWGPVCGDFGYIDYAYKAYFHENVLSLGLQVGFLNNVLDWDKIEHVRHPNDPTLRKGRTTSPHLDANVGVYWLTTGYYLGLSVKHLAPPKLDFARDTFANERWYLHMSTQFFLMSGYAISLNDQWSLRPEWFMRYVHRAPFAVNIGLHACFMNRYFLGANAQTGQNTVSFSVKGFITDWLRMGYSYNIYFGTIQAAQQGSHEISVNYQLNNLWEKSGRSSMKWL